MNTTQNQNTGQEGRAGSTHSQTGNGDSIRKGKEELKAKASGMAEDAKREGKAKADEYLNVAAQKVDTIADSVKAAAARLEEGDVGKLSTQVSGMADSLTRFSQGLREKSADEVMRDVNRLARENPAIFIGSAVAIGFGLTRVMRATAQPRIDRDRRQSIGRSETAGGYVGGYASDRDDAYTSSTITGSGDPRLSSTAQGSSGGYTSGAIGTGAAAASTSSYSAGGAGTGVGTGSTGSGLGGASSQPGQSGFSGTDSSRGYGEKRSGESHLGDNDRSKPS